jgi:hypothetical protein
MNLVDTIKNQIFSDDHLNQLSSLVGTGEGATKSAISAAVPALLSALSNLASSNRGADKLVSALGHFDAGSLHNTAQLLSGHADSVLEQGTNLLHSLLGGNTLAGIVNAVSRFSGIGGAAVQKLLGYLMPLILGGIAGRFAGKTAGAQALTSLLADQKTAITHALPSGFSLQDVPGLATSARRPEARWMRPRRRARRCCAGCCRSPRWPPLRWSCGGLSDLEGLRSSMYRPPT